MSERLKREIAMDFATLEKRCRELEAENERLREALPDPERLEMIALWFDKQDARNGNPVSEVQLTLRRWATNARAALRGEEVE